MVNCIMVRSTGSLVLRKMLAKVPIAMPSSTICMPTSFFHMIGVRTSSVSRRRSYTAAGRI